MEDELEFLVRSTLMKKNGSKYETNVFIVGRTARQKEYRHLESIAPALTEALIQALDYRTCCLDENGVKWHAGCRSLRDMKWMLLRLQYPGYPFWTVLVPVLLH